MRSSLATISAAAMTALATACTSVTSAPLPVIERSEPFTKSRVSALPVETVETRLREAISARSLTLFTVVDHSGGAARVNLDLAPSKLFIFGNPKGGTPFMQAAPDFGHELPLKVLIRQEGSGTVLVYTDIVRVARAYGMTETDAPMMNVAGTLDAIVSAAAGEGP